MKEGAELHACMHANVIDPGKLYQFDFTMKRWTELHACMHKSFIPGCYHRNRLGNMLCNIIASMLAYLCRCSGRPMRWLIVVWEQTVFEHMLRHDVEAIHICSNFGSTRFQAVASETALSNQWFCDCRAWPSLQEVFYAHLRPFSVSYVHPIVCCPCRPTSGQSYLIMAVHLTCRWPQWALC